MGGKGIRYVKVRLLADRAGVKPPPEPECADLDWISELLNLYPLFVDFSSKFFT
jgi:hypothetical protein